MFKQMKNIDTAFRYVRGFTIVVVTTSMLLSGFALYKSFHLVTQMQNKVYILANGKALEAYANDRKDNVEVEARDHVKTFHQLFFTLDPDDKVIQTGITKALYMADISAKRAYDNLKEQGFFATLIASNISQELRVDSIKIEVGNYPYRFRCYAVQRIIRPTSIVLRNLITEGFLRNVARSDNNPHGFLIERWETIENRDLKTENR
ncbi:conjugative transposon protein TraK [Solitalea lacus]|uniref:conjugative transposon protein TraK n=1 Tax=Solitalea lacus TaxID=2911172 RepID=UPI001EDB05CE|nr:conjugative transposon protein TraK [Solitalea lacus]UKJ09229.1 conjugative transposon protein TraK [Solitalea lacus]